MLLTPPPIPLIGPSISGNYKMPSADQSLEEDVEFRLETEVSDNDIDEDEQDEFKVESLNLVK